ncbi:propanediol utilization protein [Cereibacter sp. SYSU M97828]|nr:propanediol utilization protein [Cereibacter flavus]
MTLRVFGHFGELIQGRLGDDVALVTLPCNAVWVDARRLPGPFAVHGPAKAQLRRMLRGASGRFILRATMPPGGGAGASTAALVAASRLMGEDDPARIAAACIRAEGASDPLMWPAPGRLLWASRRGTVLAHLPPLPELEVLGGFLGPPVRTRAADCGFPCIADLVARWPEACSDAARLAELATLSAARTLALRGPAGDPTAALAARHGALGWSVAHTGSARALLFRPGTVPPLAARDLRSAAFRGIRQFRTGGSPCS